MGAKYKRLTYTDRLIMETMLNTGKTKADVAKYLRVSRATITREYRKGLYMHTNSDLTQEERYSCDLAQQRHDYMCTSRGKTLKISDDWKLVHYLELKIVDEKYSPEAALKSIKDSGLKFKTLISTRTLYRYIDMGLFENISNKNLAVKGRKRRKINKIRRAKRASRGPGIEKRDADILKRKKFGHWEMDTVKGKRGVTKSCLLVLTERKTRMEIVRKLPDQKAASVVKALDNLEQMWGESFKQIFKTITVDNGVEFSDYEGIKSAFNKKGDRTKVYYCHPFCSSERGSNENCNKLIRRHIPKGTDIDKYSDIEVAHIEQWINRYPRRIHKYKSAKELFDKELSSLGLVA